MSKLNDKNDRTEKIIHLLVTSLCNRNCKHCCNKQYDLNDIPYVTDEELKNAHTLCLTGGEPFLFCDPCAITHYYKRKYPNIKNVYVYTNATEFASWLGRNCIYGIDGVNVSIKTKEDATMFDMVIANNDSVMELSSNLLYVFNNLYDKEPKGFTVIKRDWQEDFEPAYDSIFRRV